MSTSEDRLAEPPPRLVRAAQLAGLLALYWGTAKLGLELDAVGGVATAVWPPTGLALAALWWFGYRLWPAIALGALLVNAERAPFLAAAGMAVGNTLEAVLATYLLRRVVGFQPSLRRLRDAAGLVAAALVSTQVSAVFGTASGWLGGVIQTPELFEAWNTWWVGNLVADLVLAPLLFVWPGRPTPPRSIAAWLEAGGLLAALVCVGLLVFDIIPLVPWADRIYLVFPVLIWASVRFGQPGGVTATFLISSLAILCTALGHGPFVGGELGQDLLALQTFMSIVAVTFLVLAAVVEERSAAQAALRDSEARYQDLYHHAPDLFLSVDQAGKVLQCNQTFLHVTGYLQHEVLGRSVHDLHHPDSLPRIAAALRRLVRIGVVRDVELQLLRKDGVPLDVSLNMSALRDEQDRVVASRSIYRDITDRKRAELRLRWALQEKETLLREVNHRVRNNLAVIDSILKMQAEQAENARLAAALRDSRNRVRSIAIIHESLYRAKDLARINFAEYIEGLARHLFHAHGIDPRRVELRLEVEKLEIDLEFAIPLGLLLNELLTNSLQHAFADGRSGRIRVELCQDAAGRIVLTVQDNGVGLPADLHLEKPNSLGLDVVNCLAFQMGGSVEVVRDCGTAVTVSFLPRRNQEEESCLAAGGPMLR